MARDHDISPVYPHPHVLTRSEVCRAVVAEPPAVFAVDPYSLAHGNLPRKLNIAVTPFRVIGKCKVRLMEKLPDSLPGYRSRCRVFGFSFHDGGFTGSRMCCTFGVPDNNIRGCLDRPAKNRLKFKDRLMI
jgi:hypothetical protein